MLYYVLGGYLLACYVWGALLLVQLLRDHRHLTARRSAADRSGRRREASRLPDREAALQ